MNAIISARRPVACRLPLVSALFSLGRQAEHGGFKRIKLKPEHAACVREGLSLLLAPFQKDCRPESSPDNANSRKQQSEQAECRYEHRRSLLHAKRIARR